MAWPAVIAAGASLLGTSAANSSAKREAEKNRRFQEDMSRTAYQRSADDLEKAGLNRILALGQPASTPTGAQPQIHDYKGVSDGIAAASAKQQIRLSEADEKLKVQQEHESFSRSLLQDQQALTQAEITRSAKSQADMDEVKRAAYIAANPLISSASDAIRSADIPRTLKRGVESISSSAKQTVNTVKNAPKSLWESLTNKLGELNENAKERARKSNSEHKSRDKDYYRW